MNYKAAASVLLTLTFVLLSSNANAFFCMSFSFGNQKPANFSPIPHSYMPPPAYYYTTPPIAPANMYYTQYPHAYPIINPTMTTQK